MILLILCIIVITKQLTPTCGKINPKLVHQDFATNQQIYSGYLPINEESDSKIAFIFYGSKAASNLEQLDNYSTLIWLNGGPGTSSQLGNYIELGPILMNEKGELHLNTQSWYQRYNLIFIDQPIGVGFSHAASFAEIPENMNQVADHFIFALKGLIKACSFESLSKASKWYFTGESFAGKYIPAIVYDILQDQVPIVNLNGIIIGNPWTEPKAIISEVTSYQYHLGLIDQQDRQYLDKIVLRAINQIDDGKFDKVADNIELYQKEFTTRSGGINYYNIRKTGSYAKHMLLLEEYLNLKKDIFGFTYNFTIQQNLPNRNGDVYKKLRLNLGVSDVMEKLEFILSKIQVVIYNGQNDATCTNAGTQRWVNRLLFKDSQKFYEKDFSPITYENKTIGYQKQAGNLAFLIVNDAGHMVPLDKPKEIFYIINLFIQV